jgi:hypothetical protein
VSGETQKVMEQDMVGGGVPKSKDALIEQEKGRERWREGGDFIHRFVAEDWAAAVPGCHFARLLPFLRESLGHRISFFARFERGNVLYF